ncbi:MAG: HEAT repeat domain-containing protein, partial [Methanophagales archaeon]|nr:HEAT repeat domain-containing protein [Methanophagales archaeon]
IQALKDEMGYVRANAAETLGKIGDERAIEPIIQALKDEDEDVRKKAAEALEKMGWQPKDSIERAYYLISKQELDKLVNIGKPAVEPLIQALKDEGGNVRANAAEVLGKIGDESAIEPLIQALKDEGVQKKAAEAIVEIGKPAVEPLIQTLKDGNWEAQHFAAEAIVKIGEPAVEPLIQAVKKDNDKNLRWKTAESIVKMMGEPAVEPLTQMLKDKDKLIREKSEGALEEIKDAIAIEPIFLSGIEELEELLATGEQDELAKENAEFMKILKGFAELLNHEDSDVRSAAAYAFRIIARTIDEKHLSCEPLYKYTLLLKEVEEKGVGDYGYDADEHAGVALDYIGRHHTWLEL